MFSLLRPSVERNVRIEKDAGAGLVFLAFALNLVDCGALLGGRLGDGRRREKRVRPLQQAKAPKRTFTM